MLATVLLPYEDHGTGSVVLLVHGHPFNRSIWQRQFAALSGEMRLVAPDLPGYGEAPALGRKTTMRELAQAVHGFLDEMAIERAVVVGLSMGGLVSMELALAHPERVAGLVLVATTAAPCTPDEARIRRARADFIERNGMMDHALMMAQRLFGQAARQNAEVLSQVITMMLYSSPAGAAAALRGRAERPDYSTLLPALQVPSLVVAGDQDGYNDEGIIAQLIRSLPDPEVVRLQGVGHLPNLEATEVFNAALADFVGRVGGHPAPAPAAAPALAAGAAPAPSS